MSNSLKASTTGLEIVDKARQRLGWTKTSTARWWQDAHTSKATLRRFWQGDRIQKEIFIAICQAVGISEWEHIAEVHDINLDNTTPFLDWNEAPDIESFYGRNEELLQLEAWINNGCKLINIIGIGGIGKTSLALAIADRLQSQFDCLIWKSLYNTPSLISLLDNLLSVFNQAACGDVQKDTFQVIQHLQKQHCLLILDGLDAVLSNSELTKFIQQSSLHRHQSCIITTGREKQNPLEVNTKAVCSLTLNGLAQTDALDLLKSRGFTGKEFGLAALIQLYRGNPLALKLATPFIQSVFAGNIAAFLNQNTLIIGERLRVILKQQLEKLSELERDIIYWLAIWQEPISFARLQTHLLISIDPARVLEAIIELEQKSLLEKWFISEETAFTLQPLVMKVVTDKVVENATKEINQVVQTDDIRHFQILRTHWLLRPGTDDIAGDRILNQLCENLWRGYSAGFSQILDEILQLLQNQSPLAIGYIACNINALAVLTV
ncbi:AAA family ATPase [Sphaerospermopsis aphanizomenoides BCCUSP55]|uniref:NB-ARC domain-containing protein n=1 Tax=Sphaerospermopsis aphanizomenoides TaxID=459663 RepID=UPI000B2538DB|nr:NB-ARC domain-containing protein [Sphaerospermopsis aphanizomenoides]MBK1989611.1 AAA family ATPase [Sphaerospermopsis aphanizomenoides BCCUSP55]